MLVLDIHTEFPHPVRPTREAIEFAAKLSPKASTVIEPVNVLRAPHYAKPVDAHGESSQCSKTAAEWRGDGAEKRGLQLGWVLGKGACYLYRDNCPKELRLPEQFERKLEQKHLPA
jgi:hypothetical protein